MMTKSYPITDHMDGELEELAAHGMYPSVARAVFNEPWAILPSVYNTICDLVRFRAGGSRLTAEEIQARVGAATAPPASPGGGVIAVIPLFGVLSQRMNMMTDTSGGTSTELFGAALRSAVKDSSVGAIVLDVDSPGGNVYGVQELWSTIMAARGEKPIVAVANSMAASAAYWVATAADEIVVSPGGEVGSIGVIAAHEDVSAKEEKEGIRHSLITFGKHKALGNPFEPLSDADRDYLQKRVNECGEMFVSSVAKGRGISRSSVMRDFGQGLMFGAKEAVTLGMADRVGTLPETLARLAKSPRRAGPRAEVETDTFSGSADSSLFSIEAEVGEFRTASVETFLEEVDDLDIRLRTLKMKSAGGGRETEQV